MNRQSQFPNTHGYKGAKRDRAVAAVVNWVIDTFATDGYYNFMVELITLGREEWRKKQTREAEELRDLQERFLGDEDE